MILETALPLLMGCGFAMPNNTAANAIITNIQSVSKHELFSAEEYADSKANIIAASHLANELIYLPDSFIEELPRIYDNIDAFAAFLADSEKAHIDGIPIAEIIVRVATFNRSASADLLERLTSFKAAIINKNARAIDVEALEAVDSLQRFVNKTLYATEQLLTLVSQVTTVTVPAKGELTDEDIQSLMVSSANYFSTLAS